MVFSAVAPGGVIAVVPGGPLRAQVAVNVVDEAIEFAFRGDEVRFQFRIFVFADLVGDAHLFKLHVQVEDFFEQVGRNARVPISFLGRSLPLCSSPISAPCSLSRYSVRRMGSSSVR